jgi:hypothetical protein
MMYSAAHMRQSGMQEEIERVAKLEQPIADIAPERVSHPRGVPLLDVAIAFAPSVLLQTPHWVCWTHILGALPGDRQAMPQPSSLMMGSAGYNTKRNES